MTPQEREKRAQQYFQDYGYHLSKGKELGLQGQDLTSYITGGMSLGNTNDLNTVLDRFVKIRQEERDPAYQKQQLENVLTFQKEQLRQAAPYKLLFDMPNQIYNAFALPGQIRLAGAKASADTVSEGLRSAAGVQMPFSYQRPNVQYF